ncbi:MAG: RecX family transcriptional regulator, partial [Spirochaetales bacterium]|nr:RecX family transcriptional regulator [Spirochaetales bacterium]
LEKLEAAGYLDDRRYAEAWVQNRLKRRPEGYPRLVAGLKQRGVKREIITSVLSEILTEEESERSLARAAEKILRTGTGDELSVLRKLTARGFPYRQAKAHLQKLQSHD